MNLNEIVTIEQLPVIIEKFAVLSEEIKSRTEAALALECTEDTVKTVKNVRADLTKDFTFFENKRKEVKQAIMKPYNEFDAAYKQYVSDIYGGADKQLKTRIDEVENGLKASKREELKAYFDEYRKACGVDFVTIERWNPNVTLSATLKALKFEGKVFIDRIRDDLALIEVQEHKEEILVEYKQSLNASQAITAVTSRHKAIEEQKAKQAELEQRRLAETEAVKKVEGAIAEQAPLQAPIQEPTPQPIPEPDPVMTVAFTVTAARSKLRILKQYLIDNGYDFK